MQNYIIIANYLCILDIMQTFSETYFLWKVIPKYTSLITLAS